MDRLPLPDAEMMSDRARLLHARHLLTWASSTTWPTPGPAARPGIWPLPMRACPKP